MLPILVYHYFGPDRSVQEGVKQEDLAFITPVDLFEKHLNYLRENSFDSVFLHENINAIVSAKSVVITIDDGHLSIGKYAVPLLTKYNCKADIYVVPTWVGRPGYHRWEDLREFSASGRLSVQSHGYNHRLLTRLTANEIRKELTESRDAIAKHVGVAPTSLAVPMGGYSNDIARIAKEVGYDFVCTSMYGRNTKYNPLNLERIMMREPYDEFESFTELIEGTGMLPIKLRMRNIAKRIRNLMS